MSINQSYKDLKLFSNLDPRINKSRWSKTVNLSRRINGSNLNLDGSRLVKLWMQSVLVESKCMKVVNTIMSLTLKSRRDKRWSYPITPTVPDLLFWLCSDGVENPYMAAQEFIWRHELSQEFLDQIARFIQQNTQGQTISQSSGTGPIPPVTTPYSSSAPAPVAAVPATSYIPLVSTLTIHHSHLIF